MPSQISLYNQRVISTTRILATYFCIAAVLLSTSAFAQVKNCEDIEFAGVKLGMSYKQARAGLVKHFNLSPSEAQKKIHASNISAAHHPSLRGKKNPTEAEILQATLETPSHAFQYNCKVSPLQSGRLAENPNPWAWGMPVYPYKYQNWDCEEPPNFKFTLAPTPDLQQPDAVLEIVSYSPTLTKEGVMTQLSFPDPCKEKETPERCDRYFRWQKRSCSWKGKAVKWNAIFHSHRRGERVFWELRVTVSKSHNDRKDAVKTIQDDEWLKAKGWWSEEVAFEESKAMCRLQGGPTCGFFK
ncbi:MAG: hypothetical protein LBQ75_05035 [Zoogloeaceae bacterium]|jgi:hypothetical protein|nr:hypothetical protein [Zoogloeaceae bacterium]